MPNPADVAILNPVEPLHYKALTPEPIAVIEGWSLGFRLGQVVKYVARAGKKPATPALTDLQKAAWYLQREIAALERAKEEAF